MPQTTEKSADEVLAEKLRDTRAIEAAVKRGFYKAVLKHRQANVPMIFVEDGKIVEVSPFDVPIPSDSEKK
jgi:hypothetical protein